MSPIKVPITTVIIIMLFICIFTCIAFRRLPDSNLDSNVSRDEKLFIFVISCSSLLLRNKLSVLKLKNNDSRLETYFIKLQNSRGLTYHYVMAWDGNSLTNISVSEVILKQINPELTTQSNILVCLFTSSVMALLLKWQRYSTACPSRKQLHSYKPPGWWLYPRTTEVSSWKYQRKLKVTILYILMITVREKV